MALMGPPNAGKSSLMNALARREVAIVTAEAGTTRDVIEVHLDLGGWPVLILDTAGIREAESLAEREGVRRAIAHGEVADIVLWLDPADGATTEPPSALAARPSFRRVLSKTDLAPARHGVRGHALRCRPQPAPVSATSSRASPQPRPRASPAANPAWSREHGTARRSPTPSRRSASPTPRRAAS